MLPPEEQDLVANWLLEELRVDERWTTRFRGSRDVLSRLAAEARDDDRAGRTNDLDPDDL